MIHYFTGEFKQKKLKMALVLLHGTRDWNMNLHRSGTKDHFRRSSNANWKPSQRTAVENKPLLWWQLRQGQQLQLQLRFLPRFHVPLSSSQPRFLCLCSHQRSPCSLLPPFLLQEIYRQVRYAHSPLINSIVSGQESHYARCSQSNELTHPHTVTFLHCTCPTADTGTILV